MNHIESEQDTYARLLTRAEPKRGYPLWFPEPNNRLPLEYRRNGVQIGDVGVVTEHGSFDVFFNICLPDDDPLHRTYGVPKGFRQIRLFDQDVESLEPADHHGRVVATRSITQNNLAIGISGPSGSNTSMISPLHGGLGLQFSSSASEGAMLVLPEGTDRHHLLNHRMFQREALRNGKTWYDFAVRKLGRTMISSDSLYLITGCHKTSSWSLAAFHNANGNFNFNAQFTAANIVNGNVTAAYTWKMTSAVPCRVGPNSYDGSKNQTVFVRGYKIAIRESIFCAFLLGDVAISYGRPNSVSRKVHFTNRGKELFDTEHGDAGTAFKDDKAGVRENEGTPMDSEAFDPVSLFELPVISKIYHPSDSINQRILNEGPSSCDVAVTHDDQWAGPTILETFCEVSSGTQEHAPGKDNYAQESPRQPKAALQKEYRKRESESESELFDQLQGYIGSMTKHQPDTRQDILAEATALLKRLDSENQQLRQQAQLPESSMQRGPPYPCGGQIGPPFNPPGMLGVGAYSQHQQAVSEIGSEVDYVLTCQSPVYPPPGAHPANRR